MIRARDEEVRIGWACAAQSSDLLPEKYNKPKRSNVASSIKGVFQDL